jgi:hypothetical protein
MIRAVAFFSLMSLALAPAPAAAQQSPPGVRANIPLVQVTPGSASGISTAQFYAQAQVMTQGFTVNAGEDKKSLGKAILRVLGLSSEARSITASIVVSTPTVTYPEIPVLAFQFDKDRNVTVSQIYSRTLPLQRIEPNKPYTVTLKYRYSNQVSFDLQNASTNLSNLLPSSVVQTVTVAPFISNLVNMAGSIFALTNSTDTNYSAATDISPFTGSPNYVLFDVRKPDGSWYGRVTVWLFATPSLMRQAKQIGVVTDVIPPKDPTEDPTTLSVTLAGATHYLVSDVKALDEYSQAVKARDDTTVRAFCSKAKQTLSRDIALTPMDRVLLTYATMTGAGFDPKDGNWFAACFDDADKTVLAQVAGIQPPPVTQPGSGMTGVSRDVKYALGCFITGQSGADCTRNAPHPEDVLRSAFGDRVRIGNMELPNVLDPATLPADRTIAREDLLAALRGKAGSFGCFGKGLLLLSADQTHSYSFDATATAGKIQSASIRSIPVEAFECRD